MKVALVISSPVNPDPRLEKEASSLTNNGHEVTIFCWDRTATLLKKEFRNGYWIYRFSHKSEYGSRSIFHWPFWWIRVSLWLFKENYDIIHAVNFDSYVPSLLVSKIMRNKCINDIFDYYPDTLPLPHSIYNLFNNIYLMLLISCDAIIIVDSCRINQIPIIDKSKISIIYNTPNDIIKLNHEVTKKTEISDSYFKIFWAGFIYPDKDVKSFIRVAQEEEGITVAIAGRGDKMLMADIQSLCDKSFKTSFIGEISYDKVLYYSKKSDLLFVLYDPSTQNNKLASPNKLFEAMMCGKPIIVNEGVATADKVREENCGLVVPYGDYEALKEAVLFLKNNPDVGEELGRNGRLAYETKYNWNIMEKRLLDLYALLSNDSDKNKTR